MKGKYRKYWRQLKNYRTMALLQETNWQINAKIQ